jgi:hypothetical protein
MGYKFPKGHVSLHDLATAGRKGRWTSPWSQQPFNKNARKTLRLELIKQAAQPKAGEAHGIDEVPTRRVRPTR